MTLQELSTWIERLDHALADLAPDVRETFDLFLSELVRAYVGWMNQAFDPQLVREIEALRLVLRAARELLGVIDGAGAEYYVSYGSLQIEHAEVLREACVKASRTRQRRGVRTVEEEG